MESIFIYYLSDKYGNIRYIGKTKNYLKQRLYAHIIECKTNRKSHKISWIKSLLSKGERPIIECIDEVSENEWEFWEQYWINQLRCWGFNLTNISIGGYNNNYKRSDITKQKMRSSKLGTKLSDEQKRKISESIKIKSIEDPNYNKCKNKTNIINKDELYQKYITENLSLNKCSSYFNVSKRCVYDNITEHGFKKGKSKWIGQVISNPEKTILQFDKDGNFIKEWIGLKSINKDLKINSSNIANCCRGIVKSAGGFIWKYKI